jgi:hypothetical protein
MNTQMTNLVEQTVMDKMRIKEAFTALDVSNALKAQRYPLRHGEVAATVRSIFQSGAMAYYDYGRRLIDVVTEGGAKKAQAFLYLHDDTREREYQRRDQNSLPPVPDDQARDISDSVSASALPPRVHHVSKASMPQSRQCPRRDGALAIPRAVVQQLGWTPGIALTLISENGQMQIVSRPPVGKELAVRVWGGSRVRICKTKLRQGDLTAERVLVQVMGASLQMWANEPGGTHPG